MWQRTLIAAAALLLACDTATAPEESPVGRHVVVAINGEPPPARILDMPGGGGGILTVHRAALDLRADGTFSDTITTHLYKLHVIDGFVTNGFEGTWRHARAERQVILEFSSGWSDTLRVDRRGLLRQHRKHNEFLYERAGPE
jgi:hypothetical protein